mmetsp:Transcript_44990/g.101618  ORF Transcript_44990/g.101618 Transcript_44990/m.101618 type:complete len:215 (+) Transcript_44990:803-1447(+)
MCARNADGHWRSIGPRSSREIALGGRCTQIGRDPLVGGWDETFLNQLSVLFFQKLLQLHQGLQRGTLRVGACVALGGRKIRRLLTGTCARRCNRARWSGCSFQRWWVRERRETSSEIEPSGVGNGLVGRLVLTRGFRQGEARRGGVGLSTISPTISRRWSCLLRRWKKVLHALVPFCMLSLLLGSQARGSCTQLALMLMQHRVQVIQLLQCHRW